MTMLLETCQVMPLSGEVTELTLPLTFFDMYWIHFHPIQRILFFEFPFSKDYFLETIVPNLKESLSLTLKHYIPIASNILLPSMSSEEKPVFRYLVGDSVSLTIAESNEDFGYLIANYARDADQFYSFVPQLPPPKDEPDYKIIPVFSLQVTLFPNRGLCFGFTNHHCIGDANSIVGFIKAWASINKFKGDSHLIEANSLPVFDRSFVKDPRGIADIFWNQLKNVKYQSSSSNLSMNKVRATFVLSHSDIERLKDSILARKPGLLHPSSYVVATAYAWTCFVKSGRATGDEYNGNEPEYFGIAANLRGRISPPMPPNYFGNCLGGGIAEVKHKKLTEEDGFFSAAVAIAEGIRTKVNNKDVVLKGVEKWLENAGKYAWNRLLLVSGSPQFDLYSVDYGWGKPRKLETLSIDGDNAIALCKSIDSEGGMEIGLSLVKTRMDAFASIFINGLKSFTNGN